MIIADTSAEIQGITRETLALQIHQLTKYYYYYSLFPNH